MDNSNAPKKLNAWTGLTPEARKRIKTILVVILIIAAGFVVYEKGWIPGLRSSKSMEVAKFNADNSGVNSTMDAALLKVPNIKDAQFADMDSIPQTKVIHWIWFANAPLYTACGGTHTMKGSIMEQYGVNVLLEMNNSVDYMKAQQLAFIKDLAGGQKHPTTGAPIVTLMGDGMPAYLATMNANIIKAYGEEYALKAFGIIAWSMGEDCVMGDPIYVENPQKLRGSLGCAVIGDGDWGLMVRYAADNGIPVNPDPATYDPNAINVVDAPEQDFLKAAEQYFNNVVVKDLKVKDASGRLTGKTINVPITWCATWFPGDRNCVLHTNGKKIISTKEYPNQMACTLVASAKWLQQNSKTATNLLTACYIAGNQIKQYPEWFDYACQLAPKVFYPNGDASEKYEDWLKYAVPGGAPMKNSDGATIMVGGTQMASLKDAQKYYGTKGGNAVYQSVYEYFYGVLKELNPCNIMGNTHGKLISYEDAVDLTYLKAVNLSGSVAGTSIPYDYSKNTSKVFAKRAWKIEFAVGSANITPASKHLLDQIYDQIVIAGNATVGVAGHTDNTGNPEANNVLSLNRAKAVRDYLIQKSNDAFPSERFRVSGLGSSEPVDPTANNNSSSARQKNRRVEISLMQ
jgi:outer membrane protein OmpA-like peptidoglycan-associated protein